jgi:hypothetical protein
VPPWAERALAGATAAVITLGITGAILAGGRSGRDLTPRFARGAAEQPFGTVDGETALGRGEGLEYSPSGSQEVLPQPAAGVLQIVPASRNPAPGGSVTTPTTVGEAPRGSPTPTTSTTVPPSGAPEDPDPEEPPSSPPTTEAPLVEARLDDGTGVSVGGSCTGIEVLNIVVGCEPDGDAASPLPPLFGS